MTSYTQTLNYLYTQLPMFTRVGEAAYKPNLDNTIKLLEALNNPHLQLKFIHVAGTNGKGSTSNMLAAVLQRAGYKTGLYTSPHLLDFRERIRVNGSMISKAFVVKFVAQNKALFLEIKPSFFEMTVALCFVYFAQQKTDIAIIETGLGGRLDSTNVIVPLLSIITNIGLDHTNLLGNTQQEIALEKAGIIKEKIPIVIGETDAITKKVFTAKAKACNSEIVFADKRMKIEVLSKNDTSIKIKVLERNKVWLEKVSLSLVGNYQLKNVATVLQSIRFLQMHFAIAAKDIQYGLGHIQALTGFAGRWQVVQKNPMVILDTGHNAHGLRQSIKQLVERKAKKIHIVFGVVRDKKLDDILPLIPLDAHYYLCAPQLPRVLPVEELEQVFSKHNFQFTACESVEDAYKYAHKRCKKNEIIFVGGSTFVVAEVLTFLVKNKKIP